MQSRPIFIIVVLVLILVFQIQAPKPDIPKSGALASATGANTLRPEKPLPAIEAGAAFAENFITGEILYEKNSSYPMPLASLTKIISSLTALDFISLDEEIKTKNGAHFKVRDILAMIMVESSNGAVETLFNHVVEKNNINPEEAKNWFLNLMFKKAELFGGRGDGMIFSTIDGVDTSENSAGAMGSARGIMQIAKSSLDSPLWQFGAIHEVISKDGLIYPLNPTNALEKEIPGLIGAKTGLTDLAGGNLLIIFEHPLGRPIGIVVLGSTQTGRFEDTKKIYEWIKSR